MLSIAISYPASARLGLRAKYGNRRRKVKVIVTHLIIAAAPLDAHSASALLSVVVYVASCRFETPADSLVHPVTVLRGAFRVLDASQRRYDIGRLGETR